MSRRREVRRSVACVPLMLLAACGSSKGAAPARTSRSTATTGRAPATAPPVTGSGRQPSALSIGDLSGRRPVGTARSTSEIAKAFQSDKAGCEHATSGVSPQNRVLAGFGDDEAFCTTDSPDGSVDVTIIVFPDAAALQTKTPALLRALCSMTAGTDRRDPNYVASHNWVVVPDLATDVVFIASEFSGSMMGVTC